MGSEISHPSEIRSTLEGKMREKALQKRGESESTNLKISDLQRRMLGALCKSDRKHLLTGDNFDAIVPDNNEKGKNIYHDGLAIILSQDSERKINIKSFLEKILPHLTDARYPEFTMKQDCRSITECVQTNLHRKIIGYTDYFLLYVVMPDRLADNVEGEVKETVDYFLKRHKGALRNVPKLFIFESCGPMDSLLPLALDGCDDVTVVVTDGNSNYQTLTERGKGANFGRNGASTQPMLNESDKTITEEDDSDA